MEIHAGQDGGEDKAGNVAFDGLVRADCRGEFVPADELAEDEAGAVIDPGQGKGEEYEPRGPAPAYREVLE